MLHECVILPLSENVEVILLAAEFFSAQYHCATHLEITGTISIEGQQTLTLSDWHSIVRIDQEPGLLGLGNLLDDEPWDDEALLWVLPTGPDKLRRLYHLLISWKENRDVDFGMFFETAQHFLFFAHIWSPATEEKLSTTCQETADFVYVLKFQGRIFLFIIWEARPL